MATIEPYETSTGARRYMVHYRTPQRTQTKKRGFKTKHAAQEFASTVEVEKMTGAYVAPSLGIITVGELAPAWLSRKESDVAPSNYRTLESAWRIHVKPVWGTARVADVDLAAVERWIATMCKSSGATTVVRAYGVLIGILDDAVKSRRLAANPSRGVENLPHKTGKRRVYLTVDDVARLAAESGQHRALVLTLRTPASDGAKRSHYGCAMSSSAPEAERPRQRRTARRGSRCWSDEEPQGAVGAGAAVRAG